jgi:hypothetical protein
VCRVPVTHPVQKKISNKHQMRAVSSKSNEQLNALASCLLQYYILKSNVLRVAGGKENEMILD